MSNPYASAVDFFDRYDRRLWAELSNDDNMPDGDLAKINRILDAQASRLEAALYGAWSLPLVINPGTLSRRLLCPLGERDVENHLHFSRPRVGQAPRDGAVEIPQKAMKRAGKTLDAAGTLTLRPMFDRGDDLR